MDRLSPWALCVMLLFVCVLMVSLLICIRLSIVLPKVRTHMDPYVFSGW